MFTVCVSFASKNTLRKGIGELRQHTGVSSPFHVPALVNAPNNRRLCKGCYEHLRARVLFSLFTLLETYHAAPLRPESAIFDKKHCHAMSRFPKNTSDRKQKHFQVDPL